MEYFFGTDVLKDTLKIILTNIYESSLKANNFGLKYIVALAFSIAHLRLGYCLVMNIWAFAQMLFG